MFLTFRVGRRKHVVLHVDQVFNTVLNLVKINSLIWLQMYNDTERIRRQ